MFLCNDSNNIRNFTFVGLTGTKKQVVYIKLM